MKSIIAKSTKVSLFLSFLGLLLTFASCRCDLEEDKETTIDKTAKNIREDSISLKKDDLSR